MTAARGLVRSTLVIGSATSVGIVLGIVRVKVLALLLGPAGVGLIGIYVNILQAGVQLAGLGLAQSGVRRVATSQGDPQELARVRRSLFVAHLVQGALGMTGIWLLRERISLMMFNDPGYGLEVGLMGLGVLVSLISASQSALLQGMRRIDDLARAGIVAGVMTTAAGIAAVWLLGADGLALFVLAQPVFLVLVTARYVARLPSAAVSMNLEALWAQWRAMAGLGATFMFVGVLTAGGLLVARSLIVDKMGLEAAGHFQAAWAISFQYVGFLLQAMGTDFFPRLSGIIGDRAASTALVNDQAQIALALGGPVLLILLGLAPWVIELLYSGAFGPAVTVLQWQCLGNMLKLASWPTGFLMIARQDRLAFMATEILWHLVFLGLLWALLPTLGVASAGIAFAVGYAVYVGVLQAIVRRLHGFRWQPLSLRLFGLHVGLSAGLLALAQAVPLAGAAAGMAAGGATGLWGLRIVALKIGPGGRLGGLAARLFRLLRWPLPESEGAVGVPHRKAGV